METSATASSYIPLTISPLSIPEAALLLAILLPFGTVLGYFFGRRRRNVLLNSGREVDVTSGATSLSAILALLGLLLAFSFGNALTLMESRKSDVIVEANALGTAFLRTDLLPEPGRTELQTALRDYAETRILPRLDRIASEDEVRAFLDRTLEAQSRLWPTMLDATSDPVQPPIRTFVAASINDVLDAHLIRLRSVSVPVTELTQVIVAFAAFAALLVLGNRSGIAGRRLTWRTFLFSALLLVVMVTILDVQRGSQGLLLIDQSPLVGALRDMELVLQ